MVLSLFLLFVIVSYGFIFELIDLEIIVFGFKLFIIIPKQLIIILI